eukprot:TRINITY_DN1395_c0_g1_i1.p1 TRINITY_DN1395_c0_g1~~TRINITY_DN1395_c0_g1_i1.p1  ORF type:complete len:222 (+),score=71.43 TRINITY_DN1395_c0_g1_i1:54-719(+)
MAAPAGTADGGYAVVAEGAEDVSDVEMDVEAGGDEPRGTFDYPAVKGGYLSKGVFQLPCGVRVGRLRKLQVCGREVWLGPCWPMPPVTACIIVVLSWLLMKNGGKAPPVLMVLAYLMCWLVLVAFIRTAYSNPGVAQRYTQNPTRLEGDGPRWKYHEASQSYHPAGTKWCEECEVFIHGYDHFCPWTGTVIGGGNKPQFNAFISAIFITLTYRVVLLVIFN